jgi:hypothetical protein
MVFSLCGGHSGRQLPARSLSGYVQAGDHRRSIGTGDARLSNDGDLTEFGQKCQRLDGVGRQGHTFVSFARRCAVPRRGARGGSLRARRHRGRRSPRRDGSGGGSCASRGWMRDPRIIGRRGTSSSKRARSAGENGGAPHQVRLRFPALGGLLVAVGGGGREQRGSGTEHDGVASLRSGGRARFAPRICREAGRIEQCDGGSHRIQHRHPVAGSAGEEGGRTVVGRRPVDERERATAEGGRKSGDRQGAKRSSGGHRG